MSAQRRGQVGGGGRSEKIRTYNFKENRVTDHRINLTLYKLDQVLAGDLDELTDALMADKRARQLAGEDGRRAVTPGRAAIRAPARPRLDAAVLARATRPASSSTRCSGRPAPVGADGAAGADAGAGRAGPRLAGARRAGRAAAVRARPLALPRLDLLVDPRVLIPRPETEQVVGGGAGARPGACSAARPDGPAWSGRRRDRLGRHRPGAGRPSSGPAMVHEVWATDASASALAVAAANRRARAARPAPCGRLPPSSWSRGAGWPRCPSGCAAASTWWCPTRPTCREAEWAGLDAEVRAEPRQALVAGAGRDGTPGLADVEAVLARSPPLARPARCRRGRAGAARRPARRSAGPGSSGTTRCGRARPGRPAPRAGGAAQRLDNRDHGHARRGREPDDADEARPAAGGARERAEVADALQAGAVVAVPDVGGYCLAVRAGSVDDEAKLVELAADPDGPHYAVGQIEDLRSADVGLDRRARQLLERCWPGPVEVFVPWSGPDGPAPAEEDGASAAPPTARRVAHGAAEYGAWAAVVGHARRAGAAPPVPRAGPVADGAAHLHRAGRGRPCLRRGRRGRRGRRRPTGRATADAGGRDGDARSASSGRARCRPPSSRGPC